MAHNRYLIRGGEDVSTEAEIDLLRNNGIPVDLFEKDNREVEQVGRLSAAQSSIWSQSIYRDVRKLIARKRYTIVHVQNFFPLISPAIYYAAKAEGCAVVQTVRNYRLLCPGALFLRDGRVCEDCLGKTFAWPGIRHGCYRGSRAGTAAIATMNAGHSVLGTWRRKVDRYITLTGFGRDKMIEAGFPASKLVVKPNFLALDPGVQDGEGAYFLYVGRLSPEKGVETLIDAWRHGGIEKPLLIIGDGPLETELRQRASDLPMIRFLGRKPMEEVYELMGLALAVCLPSLCYETFGRTLIEAYATGTPVISSRHGAMMDVVVEGQTGLFAAPGDAAAWAGAVKRLMDEGGERTRMGREARAEYERKYTPDENFRQLMAIYENTIEQSQPCSNEREAVFPPEGPSIKKI